MQAEDVKRVGRKQLERDFRSRFSDRPRLFSAPGRANLIGEHTDYNDGWVLPLSIDLRTYVAFRPASKGRIRLYSQNLDSGLETDLEGLERRGEWTDYVIGAVRRMRAEGFDLGGFDLLVDSEIPVGSGLSSSAALQVAAAFALSQGFGLSIDSIHLASLCQQAEIDFVGVRCGIMDQLTSSCGRRDHAILLDCRSLEYERVPLPPELRVVVCNSLVRHSHAEGAYNDRRRECDESVSRLRGLGLEVRALRDVTPQMLERYGPRLPSLLRRRSRHVVTENPRVLEFRRALSDSDLAAAGRLMKASHVSLRDDYQVSCPELNLLVDLAEGIPGVHGSRMMGGGFGGCTVSLVSPTALEEFQSRVGAGYEARFGYRPWIHVCRSVDGVGAE